MTGPAEALQRHVYTVLADDVTLGGLGCEVFDETPEQATTPYLVLGEFDELADDTHDRTGALVTITVHGWSRYAGYAELQDCLAAARTRLHRTRPAVPGYTDVSILHEQTLYQRDPEPELRHGIGTFTARMTQESPQ